MRIFLIILGVLMLLPGACGAIVLGIAFVEGDPGAMIVFSLPFILVGIGGIALIRNQMKKGGNPQEDSQDDPGS
jgi:hypothetical protein